jgi:hypothetical protein
VICCPGSVYIFPILDDRLGKSDNGTSLIESLLSEIKVYLLRSKALSKYFPDISHKLFPLVTFTYTFYVDEIPEIAQEEFIEMKNDAAIKKLSSFLEVQFWIRRLLDYTALSKIVLKILLPFPGT